jgi:hypothetical protein
MVEDLGKNNFPPFSLPLREGMKGRGNNTQDYEY